MKWYTEEWLNAFVENVRPLGKKGTVASYIPALAKANEEDVGIAIYQTDKPSLYAGEADRRFTLQSVSKLLALALALMDVGKKVFTKVGMEPTGDPFHSIAKLEASTPSKPLNPMINAGALAVTALLHRGTTESSLKRLLTFIHRMTDNDSIAVNEEVASSEYETAFLNRSLAYFLKQHGVIEMDVEPLLDLYTKQCAIEMNCKDLAKIGYIFANEGKHPDSNEPIIPSSVAHIINTFMVTCGMYNASGEFAIRVGVPAKSGVSGCILGAVPKRCGIGIYSPSLDGKGNSLAGIELFERLSSHELLRIF